MKNLSLVSVIVPTKNSSDFLGKCLSSIKSQTHKRIEILVIDNNSIDNTKKIARKYTDKIFNKGPERSAQRNYGVKKSKGTYLLFIDSDMELGSTVVEDCLRLCDKDKRLKAVIIPEKSFGEGFWAQCKKLERSFYVGVDWIEAARFYNKNVFRKLGGYDTDMVSGEDWDLSNRAKQYGKIGRISSYIRHNEGKMKLTTTVFKKAYYAKKISKYKKKGSSNANQQFSLVNRYKLFFSKPDILFKNPIVGLGMLFMKTLEFGFGGFSYISTLVSQKQNEEYSKR